MGIDPEFRRDLYEGTARYYDAFRVPYPAALLDDLRARARVSGTSNLMDLACGTGQVAFALHRYFEQVRAIDQEEESVAFARDKAERLGVSNIIWVAQRAEDVDADGSFELVTIGNAFHRLRRQVMADRAVSWLVRGGCIALLWSNPPWHGEAAWQQVLDEAIKDWMGKAGTTDRVPGDWRQAVDQQPNSAVLERAGLSFLGTFEFSIPQEWTAEALEGFVYSTSFLSRQAIGAHAETFEADLRRRLLACEPCGTFRETISFSYDLARRPC